MADNIVGNKQTCRFSRRWPQWQLSWGGDAGGDSLNFYRQASERVYRRLLFVQHLGIFAGVMLALGLIDVFHHVFLGSGEFFVSWVAGIWSTLVAAHFIYAFLIAEFLAPAVERHLAEREACRLKNHIGGLE